MSKKNRRNVDKIAFHRFCSGDKLPGSKVDRMTDSKEGILAVKELTFKYIFSVLS